MKNDKQTFIILTPGFASSETDTVCLPMQQQFVRTVKKLYPQLEIIIVSFQYPYFKGSYDWFGTNIVSYGGRNSGGIRRLSLRKKILSDLERLQSEKNIVGLLSFWLGECALVGKRFGEKYNIRHYCWISGQDARKSNKYVQRISAKPEDLIALSDFLQDEFEKNYKVRPAYVIPPGFDPALINSIEISRDIDILGVGSLIPLKQYDLFVEVVAELEKALPSISAKLVGEGTEKRKLLDLVAKHGLESNLDLSGELSYKEVLALMQRSKILLHPSSYEGFSGVCMEALAMGAQVISFCKPMQLALSQWHTVGSGIEMKEKAIEILTNPLTVYQRQLPYTMDETVKKMMRLFF